METNQPSSITPILQIAWTRFAQMDEYSSRRTKAHLNSRRWIAVLSVLATLLAILVSLFPSDQTSLFLVVLKFLLVLTPIVGSALAAFGSKFLSSGDWLIARAGAEEILKEIYNYRTVLKDSPDRRTWLETRLAEIQRSVFRGMNGELTMPAYQGQLPPHYYPEDPYSDPGFDDLSGDEYFQYRLETQLAWHVNKVNKIQSERVWLQTLILLSGALGAIFAVFLPLWTALAASFTAVFIGWQELRNLDSVVRNYSKVIVELNIIYDHWKNLSASEKSASEFYKLVRSTEDILWSQNVEYIKAMQEALKESDLEEEASLINRVIKEQRESDRRLKKDMEDAYVDQAKKSMDESSATVVETFKTTLSTLAEEASSEMVQAELAAMKAAMQEMAENISERFGLTSALDKIKEEFKDVDISADTPMSVLNDLLARYPKTGQVNG